MRSAVYHHASRLTMRPTSVAALMLFWLTFMTAHAEIIEAKIQRGITITANFHAGNPSHTALLILHGFLQTGHSEPMNALASNLDSKGYATLRPTMSLGINRRNQSTPCEAMHTHTVAQDIEEIDYWFKWLLKKGYRHIVLTGFSSTGNFESMLYSAQKPDPAITQLILISLNPILVEHNEQKRIRRVLHAGTGKRPQAPELFTLGYCKRNFAATPASYASYAVFDDSRLLDMISRNRLPLDIVLGSNDTILPESWIAQIDALKSKAAISVIPNANHFFDGTSEFDLAETVENILKRQTAQP